MFLSQKIIINNFLYTKIIKEKTFRDNGYVYGIDCGDGFTGIYLPPSSSSWIQ